MSGAVLALGAGACALSGMAAAFALLSAAIRADRAKKREASYGRSPTAKGGRTAAQRSRHFALRYAETLTRRLYADSTIALSPSVRSGKAATSRAGAWFEQRSKIAGCSKEISADAYCETRVRLALVMALAGALAGMPLSNELGLLLGVAGFLLGLSTPKRAIRSACRERTATAQRYLSEMLEVVSLGLRSGLTFDRSFELYGSHFDNGFARSCARAHRSWSIGIVTREDALRELASSYECEQLSRIVDSIVRSLRFGSALTELLEEAAAQSRANYRTALEERVAKAPVKMMLPTGTLILPAMLLLVLGPILLELAGGFR